MPTYKKTTDIHSFYPTVIHTTYLHSDSDSCSDPKLQLHFDGTVMASTLTGLSLHTLLDTGCHKTLLSKNIYDQNKKHFQNSIFGKTFYKCGKWTTNFCSQDDSIAIKDSRSLF